MAQLLAHIGAVLWIIGAIIGILSMAAVDVVALSKLGEIPLVKW
jgi:hypothetical protein